MDRVKVSVLGVRGFASSHLPSWERAGVELSIFDRDPGVLEQRRKEFNVSRTFNDINKAIADADIVDILMPHHLHKELAVKAMTAGKHVLVEKPIATEIGDAQEMIRTARKMGVKLMVAEQLYFDRSVKWIMETLKTGGIGRLLAIVVRDQRFYGKQGWRTKAAFMGGGALIDGGIHYVHLLLNFGGEYSEIRGFTAKGASSLEEKDTILALYRFRSGAIGSLFYCWSYPEPPHPPAYEVIGTEASIVEDSGTRPEAHYSDRVRKRYIFGFPRINGKLVEVGESDVFDDEIIGFLRSVVEGTDVPMDPALALRDLKSVKEILSIQG